MNNNGVSFHEAQVVKTYLAHLSEAELRKAAYEMFVHLQKSRAENNRLQNECKKLEVQNAQLVQYSRFSGFALTVVIEELG